MIKGGAEGVYMAALPQRGLGLALKVLDGGSQASSIALEAMLAELGVLDGVLGVKPTPIYNKAGDRSGQIQVVVSAPAQHHLG